MFDDIISGLASALGTTDANVEFLLSVIILVGVGIVIGVSNKANGPMAVFILTMVAGVLTAFTWIPLGLFIIAVIAAIAYLIFGRGIGAGAGG